MRRAWLLLAWWLPMLLSAHPLAPALLRLSETAVGDYEVLWRTSISRVQGTNVQPEMPATCSEVSAAEPIMEDGEALVTRWTIHCPAGLAGSTVSIRGLEAAGINVIFRMEWLNGRVSETLLDASQSSFAVPDAATAAPVFRSYLQLGVMHLLTGLDHLLFVTGLWLLVRGLRPLLFTLTAFTLGHSLTLAAASLGLIHVNQAVAELGIALSILLLAAEVVKPATQPVSILMRRPWLMASGFGLLHGLGFAGALADVGLPQGDIVSALLAFNIGIEAGQLLWVSGLLLMTAVARWLLPVRLELSFQWRTVPAYGIGSLAAFWCYQRSIDLLS